MGVGRGESTGEKGECGGGRDGRAQGKRVNVKEGEMGELESEGGPEEDP